MWITACNMHLVKIRQIAPMERKLTSTVVPVHPAGLDETAMWTLMSVSLDTVRIMQHVIIL